MPIPKPKKNEKKSVFVNRCFNDSVMKEEFPSAEQRWAVCYNQWKKKNKKGEENFTSN